MRTHLVLLVGLIYVLLIICFSGYSSASRAGDQSSKEQSWVGLTKDGVYQIGPWQTYLKTENFCLNFRQNTTPGLFIEWPENEGQFCCEDKLTPHTIASYVHSQQNGRYLHPIAYYDVGIVEAFTPFWRSWLPDRISQKDITNLAYCEVNDVKSFYVKRFWRDAMAKQGLLYSGIPFILLVELLVVLSPLPELILSKLGGGFAPVAQSVQRRREPVLARSITSTRFPRFLGWETTWDLVHLVFLGVNGSLLMGAVGHSDPCGWEAVVLCNSAVVCTYLTLLSIVSAVLQQTALWSRATTNERLLCVEQMAPERIVEGSDWKVKRHKVEKEWQLQRISAQCAVLFVGSLCCTLVTVYSRDEFVAWLLGIIIIAQVWSCTVGFAMLSQALKLGRECYKQRRVAKERERGTRTRSPNQKQMDQPLIPRRFSSTTF